ncbi:MAG: glycosyltransferase family 4 protein [Desulfococcaceae bacterium]|jgi:glycosyltransferase involved in cell wall biosynthesis|nr:glycosyltransferase family 4 protein [Desulfococcaceae bacterium]
MQSVKKKKIKIFHIITRMDAGGSAQNTLQSCLSLSPEKYQIYLIHGRSLESRMAERETALVNRGTEKAESMGVTVISLPFLVRRIDPLRDGIAFFLLWRIMQREKPDIVHTHTSKAGILGRWAAKAARIPRIIHTPHGHIFYGHFSGPVSAIFLLAEKLTSRITDAMIALTENEKKDYLRLKLCPENKIPVIHSGVDTQRFAHCSADISEMKRDMGIRPRAPLLCSIGWLLPVKGPMVLFRAMQLVWRVCPEAVLLYVGKGEMQKKIMQAAEKNAVSGKVHFTGWREDIPEILHMADILVLPSLNEGMGRVLVEAMAAGKAIVASRTGGIPSLIREGENGLLVPPGNAEKLGQALIYLIQHPERAAEMGIRGKKYCQNFSLLSMIQKLDSLYETMI